MPLNPNCQSLIANKGATSFIHGRDDTQQVVHTAERRWLPLDWQFAIHTIGFDGWQMPRGFAQQK